MNDSAELPPALHGRQLRRGIVRLTLFAAVVVVIIVAVPGLGSIRSRLVVLCYFSAGCGSHSSARFTGCWQVWQ
jgi:hypothetical protein